MFLPCMYAAAEDGHKTETSRFGGLTLVNEKPDDFMNPIMVMGGKFDIIYHNQSELIRIYTLSPRYKVGEILFIKEPWYKIVFQQHEIKNGIPTTSGTSTRMNKMFMPEGQAKRWVRIIGIRIRQVQNLTDADYKAEGIQEQYTTEMGRSFFFEDGSYYDTAALAWQELINQADKTAYNKNYWSWVYTFEWLKNKPEEKDNTVREGEEYCDKCDSFTAKTPNGHCNECGNFIGQITPSEPPTITVVDNPDLQVLIEIRDELGSVISKMAL